MENSKILIIILKLIVRTYIPNFFIKVLLIMDFGMYVWIYSFKIIFKILLFSKNVGASCYSLHNTRYYFWGEMFLHSCKCATSLAFLTPQCFSWSINPILANLIKFSENRSTIKLMYWALLLWSVIILHLNFLHGKKIPLIFWTSNATGFINPILKSLCQILPWKVKIGILKLLA